MSYIGKNRRRFAALAASMFLAVWASMAIAPCLMAAEAIVGEDCPHCPDPPPPCHDPGGTSACTYVDGYDFDGRSASMPKVDVEWVLAPPLESGDAAVPGRHGSHVFAAVRAPPGPHGPRLHLRYCVLID